MVSRQRHTNMMATKYGVWQKDNPNVRNELRTNGMYCKEASWQSLPDTLRGLTPYEACCRHPFFKALLFSRLRRAVFLNFESAGDGVIVGLDGCGVEVLFRINQPGPEVEFLAHGL